MAARIDDVGEDTGGSEEDVVLANDPGVKGDIVLHFHVVAQHHLGRDNNVLTNVTVFTDYRTGHDMGKVPDFRAGTDDATGIDDGGWMGEEFRHRF